MRPGSDDATPSHTRPSRKWRAVDTELDILDKVAQIVHEVREKERRRIDDDNAPPVYSWLGIQDESERPSYDIAAAIIKHILPDVWDEGYWEGDGDSRIVGGDYARNPYRDEA